MENTLTFFVTLSFFAPIALLVLLEVMALRRGSWEPQPLPELRNVRAPIPAAFVEVAAANDTSAREAA